MLFAEEEGRDLSCLAASLIQVMLDPYFRTIVGFQSLIQKEWVMAGYQFLDRCNHLKRSDKEVKINYICMWSHYLLEIILNIHSYRNVKVKISLNTFISHYNSIRGSKSFQGRGIFSLPSVAMWESVKYQVQSSGLCCFRVTHESISLLQALAQLTFQIETKGGEEWGWRGLFCCVLYQSLFLSLWCYHSAVLSEQGADTAARRWKERSTGLSFQRCQLILFGLFMAKERLLTAGGSIEDPS